MPNLNELRAVGAALPPSERLLSNEIADVVSALVAVGTHGDEIVKAAHEGKIGDFFHAHATKVAEDEGTDPPRRGNVEQQPGTSAAPVNPLEQKVDDLSKQFATLVDKLGAMVGNAQQPQGGTVPQQSASRPDPTPTPPTATPSGSDSETLAPANSVSSSPPPPAGESSGNESDT